MSKQFYLNRNNDENDDFNVTLKVSLPSCDESTCDGSTHINSSDDFYNLTKLAEVSLAAAAGELIRHRREDSSSNSVNSYSHKIFDRNWRVKDAVNTSDNTKSYDTYSTWRNDLNDSGTDFNADECDSETGENDPIKYPKRGNEFDDEIYELEGKDVRELNTNSDSDGRRTCEHDCHRCQDCGKRYSTSSNLTRHRQTHRSPSDKKARRCPHCGKLYVSMPAFAMHVRTHALGCRCPHCGKCFSRPWLLQGHIRTHTGEKPFKCSICAKAFADKSNLRAHVQTHSNTKPHVCGRCGKAFALKSYLYKHEESSCMRANVRRTPLRAWRDQVSEETIAPKSVFKKTSVISYAKDTNLENSPNLYRSTVIRRFNENDEDTVSPVSNLNPQEEPVDFSTNKNRVIRSDCSNLRFEMKLGI